MANGFIDKARITVRAGNGGNGAVAFHREKYIAAGGPVGGDGGNGGDIVFRVDPGSNTLLAFRYKRKFVAESGENGKGGKLYELSGKINSLESRLTEAVNSRLKINETQEKLSFDEMLKRSSAASFSSSKTIAPAKAFGIGENICFSSLFTKDARYGSLLFPRTTT